MILVCNQYFGNVCLGNDRLIKIARSSIRYLNGIAIKTTTEKIEHRVEARIPYKMSWDFKKRPWANRIYAQGVVVYKIRAPLMGKYANK